MAQIISKVSLYEIDFNYHWPSTNERSKGKCRRREQERSVGTASSGLEARALGSAL
jgi:hypothetical protein